MQKYDEKNRKQAPFDRPNWELEISPRLEVGDYEDFLFPSEMNELYKDHILIWLVSLHSVSWGNINMSGG